MAIEIANINHLRSTPNRNREMDFELQLENSTGRHKAWPSNIRPLDVGRWRHARNTAEHGLPPSQPNGPSPQIVK
jgi:hypothetical protein